MKELDLEARKKISFFILNDIDQICRENHIDYYMAYGTLIGTIRHSGFIPWDDDIDIWVKWEDYKPLINLLRKKTRYEIINPETDERFPLLFSKVSDPATIVERTSKINGDFRRGIAVDVFPLCPYHDHCFFKFNFKMILAFAKLFSRKKILENAQRVNFKGKLLIFLCAVLSGVGLDEGFWLRKIEKLFANNHTDLLFSPYSPYKLRDVHPKKYFEKTVDKPFEGKLFKCPCGFDAVLRQIYGDYMQLPPEDKQVSNHDTIAYTLDK